MAGTQALLEFGDPRLPARFWEKVTVASNGCWLWTGAHATEGYGYFRVGSHRDGSRRNLRAHRVTYELLHSEIPEGLEPDHLCRRPACVNPAHIEIVTTRENQLRGTNPLLNHLKALSKGCCPMVIPTMMRIPSTTEVTDYVENAGE